MAGLRDIAPLRETVMIRGQELDIVGLNLATIGYLLERFPQIGAAVGKGEISAASISSLGSDVVAAIIAAGTGAMGDKESEEAAKYLTIDEELEILSAVLKVSMRRGGGPFAETLLQIMRSLGLASAPSVSSDGKPKTSTPSRKPSNP